MLHKLSNLFPRRVRAGGGVANAPSKYSIDRWWIFQHCVFCQGWWSERETGRCVITSGTRDYSPDVIPAPRPDVESAHGPGAARWGFRLRCMLDPELTREQLRSTRLSLLGARSTVVLERPGELPRMVAARDLARAESQFFAALRAVRNPTVLEIGSRARSGISRRTLFPTDRYVGFDILSGPNVDVVGDAHLLSRHVPKDHFQFVYSMSTFEHLLMPWKVVVEMNRVMRAGGLAFVHSHQSWPAHDEPWDFWRFSKWGWRALFNHGTGFEVVESVNADPATILSAVQSDNAAVMTDGDIGYQTTAVLVRKITGTSLNWDYEPDMEGHGAYPK